MKLLKNALILLCFAISFSASAQSKKVEKAVIQTNIYCDHCKQCETCGKGLQSGLLKIKGVKMYELNEDLQSITVFYSPGKTNLDAIREAISKMGYDADDRKADPAAYDKLDGCCKKV